jgi:enamine deaminase RidA (YjgF/YER057c/UK114 family)
MARQVLEVAGIAPPLAHYSHGIVAGGLLFIAGQVPVDRSGELVAAGDPAGQARQVLANLGAVLAAAGADLGDVVKTTTFLVDLAHRGPVGEARRVAFTDPPPANTLLVVSSLADPEFLVEIEAIARIPG